MFIDARSVSADSVVSADLCIVGTGPAGLTLVKELMDTGLSIVVLESGDLEADPEAQDLASGQNLGRTYFDLDVTRLRYFGGSSNHWGGRCLPLTPHDFSVHSWIPNSGWPLTSADLDPYYRRAHKIIGIGKFEYDAPRLAKEIGASLFPLDPAVVQTIWTRVHPLNFGEHMHASVKDSTNVRIFLRAHALELETDQAGVKVERVRVGTLTGNRFSVEAKKFVVACGGLENPRLLKLSTNGGQRPAGIGNDHDLVGRYFMEHLLYDSGFMAMNIRENIYKIYNEFLPYEGHEVQATLALNPQVLEKEKISNVYFEFQLRHGFGLSPSVTSAMSLFKSFEHGHWPRDFVERASDFITDIDTMIDIGAKIISGKPLLYDQEPIYLRTYYYSEQVPNPKSRVVLGTEKDAFGQPQIALDWQLDEIDLESARIGHEILASQIGASGIGRAAFNLGLDQNPPMPAVSGGHHHMGTTRMHTDPRKGVVDVNCRVHGTANLYIGGSSVFPTSGYANPTLTITALSCRLADHIRSQI